MEPQEKDPGAAQASKPTEIPKRAWKDILKATWKESNDDNVEIIAAGVAFYAFLAFVPLLTAFVLSYGLVAEPSSVVSHMQTLTQVMPQNAASIIGDQLQSMTDTAGGKTGFALLLAIGIALYGASRGAGAIITALNIAYEVDETRGFVKRTLMSFVLTGGAIMVLFLAILAISGMHFVERILPTSGGAVHFLLQAFSYSMAAVGIGLLLAAIYRYGPNRPDAKWRWITPGSTVATIVWIAATLGFGFYVSNFGSYNATYGSLGAVIVFLTWLYLTAYIILMGAELNSEMERKVGSAAVAEQGGAAQARGSEAAAPRDRPVQPARPGTPAQPGRGPGALADPRPGLGELAWKWGAFAILLRFLPRRRAAAR